MTLMLTHLLHCWGPRQVRLAIKGGMIPGVYGGNPDAADAQRLSVHAQLVAQVLDHPQLACNTALQRQQLVSLLHPDCSDPKVQHQATTDVPCGFRMGTAEKPTQLGKEVSYLLRK